MVWEYVSMAVAQQARAISKAEWEKIEGQIIPWEEWIKALDMNEGFTLSKDRPWKLRNWLAYFIGRVFL